MNFKTPFEEPFANKFYDINACCVHEVDVYEDDESFFFSYHQDIFYQLLYISQHYPTSKILLITNFDKELLTKYLKHTSLCSQKLKNKQHRLAMNKSYDNISLAFNLGYGLDIQTLENYIKYYKPDVVFILDTYWEVSDAQMKNMGHLEKYLLKCEEINSIANHFQIPIINADLYTSYEDNDYELALFKYSILSNLN